MGRSTLLCVSKLNSSCLDLLTSHPCPPPRALRLQLLAGASWKNLPNLRNLAMELRKVCCHPVSAAAGQRAALSRGRHGGEGRVQA